MKHLKRIEKTWKIGSLMLRLRFRISGSCSDKLVETILNCRRNSLILGAQRGKEQWQGLG